jgi:FAD/FMN-containing dehydrogenase
MTNIVERLRRVVGEQNVLTAAADVEPYVKDWRGIYVGTTPAVVRPANTEEVAAVVKLCAETGTPIVPQGGNTGMCMASVPRKGANEIVVSLARLNRIREVDPLNNTLTAEAGVILASIQQAADQVDRLFPLSLGGQGSCMIGGNLSTNAGGVNVLRYGNTRELVLGLEVVLPDGRTWNGLRSLRKDNTGYDLKHLFVGAEGTLGIITTAVLKLFPKLTATATAWAAVKGPDAALELLALVRRHCGERINAFELISRNCLDLVVRHIPGTRDPLSAPHEWYVLTELGDSRPGDALRAELEAALEDAMEAGLVLDVTIAGSGAQSEALWKIRETIPEAAGGEAGMLYRHDIAVAVSAIPEFIRVAGPAIEKRFPGANVLCFGHLGDGNLHYNAYVPGRTRSDAAAREAHDVTDLVYDLVQRFGGSFSAEHGIGLAKVKELQKYKSAVEVDLMRTVKRALDPQGLMNPGKVL